MGQEPQTSRAIEDVKDLQPELLRSVPLHACLGIAGRAWWQNQKGFGSARMHTGESRVADFCMQTATNEYDYFFSHDWRTSGRLKYVSLLIVFNGVPAALSSFVVSTCLGVLTHFGFLSRSAWSLLPGHVVPWLVLVFWQDVLRLFRKPERAFLDSLCIPQDDQDLKERCIRGLASYLRRSKKLVVLWSPNYFRRLWCTFEVGFFLMNLQGQVEDITFVPVQIGTLCILCYATATVFRLTLFLVQYSGLPFMDFVIVVIIAVFVLAICLTPAFFYYWSALLRDVSDLPRQLREFRLESSECFCCSHGHRHPVSGENIFCDRALIYQNLKVRGCGGREEQALDAFNGHVRRILAPNIEQKSKHHLLVLKHTLVATAAACFPHLAVSIPRSLERRVTGWRANVLFAGSQIFLDLAVVFLLRVTLLIGQLGHRRFFRRHRFFAIAMQVVAFCLAACGVLLPWPLSVILAANNSMLPFVSVVLLLLANICLLRPLMRSGPPKSCSMSAERPTPAAIPAVDLHSLDNSDNESGSCFEI